MWRPFQEGNALIDAAAIYQTLGGNGWKPLADLNACSQKGLVEMFDASIGAATRAACLTAASTS